MLQNLRLIYAVLSRKERVQAGALAVAMIMTGAMEMGSVGSVLPFMQIVADPSILQGEGWQAAAYSRLGFSSPEAATMAAGAALLVIIIANNALNVAMIWATATWGWGLNHRLSATLLGRYVHQPYAFFLGRNTATLNRTLLGEVNSVISGVLIPIMAIAARSISALLIVVLLAWVDPRLVALLALSIGGAYLVVYLVLRPGQRRRGRERLDQNGVRFRIAGEALTGIKDVKALGREDEFLRRFEVPSRRFTRAVAHNNVASLVPRYALETVGVGAILILILGSLRDGADLGAFLPVLSVYVFGAYRLMPALNGIFRSAVVIRFNSPALEEVHRELTREGAPAPGGDGRGPEDTSLAERSPVPDHGRGPARIELTRLSFRYPGAASSALTEIDLRIEAHQIVGFVGRTGAGKTTLVDIVLGLLTPTAGAVLIDGFELNGASEAAWRSRCGYVPQDIFVADDSVMANIAFGVPADEVDRDAVVAAARVAQVHDFVAGLPRAYDTVVGERGVRMSGGQRQRIGIARALYHDPDVLLFDEATSALDGVTESAVLETIDALAHRKTILVVAHRLTTVKACDVIHVLDAGRIVASGGYDQLLQNHDDFRAMAGDLAL